MTLKSRLGVIKHCEFVHDLYIADIYLPITLSLIIWVYLHSPLHSELRDKAM